MHFRLFLCLPFICTFALLGSTSVRDILVKRDCPQAAWDSCKRIMNIASNMCVFEAGVIGPDPKNCDVCLYAPTTSCPCNGLGNKDAKCSVMHCTDHGSWVRPTSALQVRQSWHIWFHSFAISILRVPEWTGLIVPTTLVNGEGMIVVASVIFVRSHGAEKGRI